jgi:hypothetical protein
MKTAIKVFLVLFVAVSILATAALLAVYFSPGMQRGMVLAGLRSGTTATVELQHLNIRLSRAEIRGLVVTAGDESLRLDSLQARYSLRGLMRNDLRVESLVAEGLVLDVAASGGQALGVAFGGGSGNGAGGEPAGAVGPASFTIEGVQVDGSIILPDGLRADFDLTSDAAAAFESGSMVANGQLLLAVVAAATRDGVTETTRANLTASIRHVAGINEFQSELALDTVSLDHWGPVLAAFGGEEPAAGRDPTPDKAAPWAGLEGTAVLTVGRLVSGANEVTSLRAEAVIDQGRQVRARISGMIGDSPLSGDALVDFNAANPAAPYTLSGKVDLRGLDVTPLFKPQGSRQPGILEGVFNLQGSFHAQAPNLAHIADRASGELTLQSAGNGIFRPLGEQTSTARGISGLLGSLSGSIKELRWVQEVVDQVQEIPYTRMVFHLGRDQNLDLVMRDLDLVSRETRLRGSGRIPHQEGVALAQLPIDIQLNIFAKGRLAEALRTGRQLRSETPDDLGYLPGPPLPIKGTLGKPESLLVSLLMDSAQQLLPGLLRPR